MNLASIMYNTTMQKKKVGAKTKLSLLIIVVAKKPLIIINSDKLTNINPTTLPLFTI